MKIKKNKFIIGLSTTLLGSVIAAGGEVAYASAQPEQPDLTPTNDIVENVVDDYNKVIDDSEELNQLTEDNKDLADTKVDEVSKEESAQASDLSETRQADAIDENKADTTNETEEDTTTYTAEGTNSASETTNDEEDVLTEPSNTTEPPTEGDKAVENPAEENTSIDTDVPQTQADQNPDADVDVEAGAVLEDSADTASTQSADETQAANDLVEELDVTETADKALDAQANTPNDPSVEEGAPLDGVSATAAAGPTPYAAATGESGQTTEPDYKADAESIIPKNPDGSLPKNPDGSVDDSYFFIPVDTIDREDPLNPKNQENIEDAYNGINLKLDIGDAINDYYVEGVKIRINSPARSHPGDVYELDILIDTEESGRAISFMNISGTILDKKDSSPFDVPSTKSFPINPIGVGKETFSGKNVTYETEGPILVTKQLGRGDLRRNYRYVFSDNDLIAINTQEDEAVLGYNGKYARVFEPLLENEALFTSDNFSVYYTVVPFPNENKNGKLITLNTDDINKFENQINPIQDQTIKTGIKVDNLLDHDSYNDASRLVGQAYDKDGNPLKDVRVYYEDDQVKIDLPQGALQSDGTIFDRKSGTYRNYRDLNIELFMKPRTEDELKVEVIDYNGEITNLNQDKFARYNHYNKVGKFTLNIDDKSNYQIGFSKDGEDETYTLKELTAGKDYKIDTTSNDQINPEVYKNALEAAKRNEVKMTLDQGDIKKLQDKGWTVTTNADADPAGGYKLGDIVVRPPLDAEVGDEGILRAYYDFTNGSRQTFILPYRVTAEGIVKPTYEPQTKELEYINENGELVQNDEANKIQSPKILDETTTKVKPSSYALKNKTIKDKNGKDWTFEIDNGGEITATPPSDLVESTTVEVPVELTYTDTETNKTFTREVTAEFTAIPDQDGYVYYKDEVVEFNTKIEYSDELAPGASKITQEGKLGKARTKYKVTTENGESVEEQIGESEPIEEAQDQIILVGKVPSTDIEIPETQNITIPAPTNIVYRNDKPIGYRNETPGEDGEVTITYEKDQNGNVIGVKSETVTKAAVAGTIEIGTQPIESPVTPDVEFKTSEDLAVGESRRETIPGTVETKLVEEYNPETGRVETVAKTVVTPPKEVITVGTKDYTGEITYTEKEFVDYETIIKVDNTKAPGYRNVEQEGKVGVTERDVTRKITNGTAGDPTYSEDRVTPKQDQIITVGALTEGTNSYVSDIPFGYTVEYDESIPAGEYRIEKPGVVGEKRTTWTVRNSEVVETNEEIIKDKEDAIIKVSSKAFEGTVTNTVTQQLPYEIEIVESADLPVGTRFVRQEGEAGSVDITYSQDVKNGAADGGVTATESNKIDPKNHIIVVGTKPIDTPVKPEITIERDSNIDAGEVIVGDIVPGKVVTTTEKTIDPLTGKEVVREVTTTTPPTQTIKVGTKAYDGKVEYKEQKVTPFETEIIFDDTIAPGKEVVEKPGVNKVEERTITQNYINGQLTDKVEGEFTTVTEGQKQVIRVGTMTNGVHEHEEDIPFEVTIIEDENLKDGEYKVEKEGVVGKETTTWEIVNSKIVEGSEKTTTTKQAENAIIRVGTKDHTGTAEYTTKEETPFTVRIQENPSLAIGKRNVIQQGKPGSKEYKYVIDIVNGKQSGKTRLVESHITDPVEHIIEVGTKQVPNDNISVEKPIVTDFDVIYDDTKDKGYVEISDPVPGKVETRVVEVFNPETGEIETTTEEVVVTNPKQTITIGTKDLEGSQNTEVTKVVPFETEYIYDDTLASGERVIDQQGSNGVMTVTYTTIVKNGAVVDTKITENITTEPIKQIVRVGTKEKVSDTKTYTTVENIPYETIVEFDPNMAVGSKEVVTKGELGEKSTVITITTVDGVTTTDRKSDISKQPVNEVIKVGTKTPDSKNTVTYEKVRVIPFATEVTYDDTLDAGKVVVDQEGVNGEETFIYSTEVVNGVASDTKVIDKVTKQAVTKKIRVGTKAAKANEETKLPNEIVSTVERPLAYKTEYIYDSSLPVGETKEEQAGKDGVITITYTTKLVDGKWVTESKDEITTEAVVRKVRVGTKSAANTYNEVLVDIPFETEVIFDDTLEAGKEVVTPGKLGSKKVTITTIVENGIVNNVRKEEKLQDPVNQIIKVGTKCPDKPQVTDGDIVKSSTVEIPFTTIVKYDPNLEAGKVIEDVKGQNGERTITVTIPVKNGIADEPIVKDEQTKAPIDRVIIVGTKKPTVKPETPKEDSDDIVTVTEVPEQFETEIIYDDTLPSGKVVEEQEGINGVRTITTIIKITDGKAAEPIVTEKVTKEAQKRIIRVGTKTATNNDPIIDEKIVEIPFETIVTYDPDLEEGKARVIRPGQKGEKTITTITKIVNGKEVTEVVEVITKQPVDEIRIVGTKVTIKNPVEPKPGDDDSIVDNPVAPKPGDDDSIVDNPVAPKPSDDDAIVDIPVVPEQGEDNKTEIPGVDSKDDDNININTKEDNIDDVKTPGIDETERVTEDDNEDISTEENEDKVDENIGVISKDKDSEVDRIGVSGEYEKTDKEKEEGSQYFINENEPDIPRTSNKSDNPKTGITGTSSVLTALGISIAGFAASKKKKEDDKE